MLSVGLRQTPPTNQFPIQLSYQANVIKGGTCLYFASPDLAVDNKARTFIRVFIPFDYNT
jgi:hypothetical protein